MMKMMSELMMDDDEFFCGMGDRRKAFSLFPARTIVRGPHHHESPIRRE